MGVNKPSTTVYSPHQIDQHKEKQTMPKIKVRHKASKHNRYKKHAKAILVLFFTSIFALVFLWVAFFKPHQQSQSYIDVKTSSKSVRIPQDDAAHDDMTEWWYYNGHLETESGEKFSYHYTIFAHKALTTHTIVHLSLLDHQTNKSYQFQKRIPGFESSTNKGKVLVGSTPWTIALNDGKDHLQAKTPKLVLNLHLESKEDVILQDTNGFLDFEIAGGSYYYSRPRMQTSGEIQVENKTYTVPAARGLIINGANLEPQC